MTSPGNHQSTAAKLDTRGINFKRATFEGSLDFDDEWQRFAAICGCQTTAQAAWSRLEPIISGFHPHETAFDRALFGCITALLGDHVDRKNDNLFVLANHLNIGLARQVDRKAHLGFNDEYGLTTGSINDHAIAMVDENQNIVDETAVVELKTDDANCRAFPFINDRVSSAKLSSHHGAFGQALIYVAGDVINCLARRGIDEDIIEVLVVSGKKQSRVSQQRLCYVRGRLLVPQKCGGRFFYNVLDCEGYETADCEKHALAAYLYTLVNGIERALRSTTRALPLCGKVLVIGNLEIANSTLVGSPIPRVKLTHDVGQGEIFRTRLVDVLPGEDSTLLWMIDTGADLPDANVLVKVSSQATHKFFVPPFAASAALVRLHLDDAARIAVSDVLVGAWRPNQYSLVTITKELSGFGPVQPASCPSLSSLWSGFVELVDTVLIPMAEAGVVHADIRTGWTETANILQHPKGEGRPPTLKLIDYESLCLIQELPQDDSNWARTFQLGFDEEIHADDYTALRYLWWQCIFVAFTWTAQVDLTEVYDWQSFVVAFDAGDLDPRFWGALTQNQQSSLRAARSSTTVVKATVKSLLSIMSSMPAFES